MFSISVPLQVYAIFLIFANTIVEVSKKMFTSNPKWTLEFTETRLMSH